MSRYEWLDFGLQMDPVSATLYSVKNRIDESGRNPNYRVIMDDGPLVAGFLLPPFQRGLVWDEERMIRFVDSARRGLPLGTYTVNTTFGIDEARRVREDGSEYFYGEGWLLDGQQRLTSLEYFFADRFPVAGRYWSEVPTSEARAFLMHVKFPLVETKFTTELEAAEYYDLMNFGGVAHTEDQRAIPVADPKP